MVYCLNCLHCRIPNVFIFMLPLIMSIWYILRSLLLFVSCQIERAWCCWIVDVLLVPRELLCGCRGWGTFPWLMLVCFNRTNVVIGMCWEQLLNTQRTDNHPRKSWPKVILLKEKILLKQKIFLAKTHANMASLEPKIPQTKLTSFN